MTGRSGHNTHGRNLTPMNQSTKPPATLSVDETARLLGVSSDAVRDAVARGEIASLRVGRRVLISAAPLHRALGIELSAAES